MVLAFLQKQELDTQARYDLEIYGHCACDSLHIDFTGDRVHANVMHLYFEIRACFIERRMCRGGNDAGVKRQVKQVVGVKDMNEIVHLRVCDAFNIAGPVAVGLDGHDDGLGTTRSSRACTAGVVVPKFEISRGCETCTHLASHSQTHSNNFRLHLPDGYERASVIVPDIFWRLYTREDVRV